MNLQNLKSSLDSPAAPKKIMRTGVYGVAINEGKILLISQQRGPYAGKHDFPGGGIEFGESVKNALRREFVEELAMGFDSLQLIDNLTATVEVAGSPINEPYIFYQIGMIYKVEGLHPLKDQRGDLQHNWIDPAKLSKEKCSLLLWQFLKDHLSRVL